MFVETTLNDLVDNIEKTFPNTTHRQHSTDTIKISRINWIPFVGLKTLYIKGLAQNEGREYNPSILFKNVTYLENGGKFLKASDGKDYRLKKLSTNENNVLVRCNCNDFYWRFQHWNHEDRSLYGRDRKPYVALTNRVANPMETAGLCKHLIKLSKAIQEAQVLL